MSSREQLFGKPGFTAFFLVVSLCAIALLHACRSSSNDEIQPAGPSFFPLSVGNSWVFTAMRHFPDSVYLETKDTLLIEETVQADGKKFYRLRWTSWSGTQTDTWVWRDKSGNIHWSDTPQGRSHQFLIFDACVGETWDTGREGCLDSLRIWDDYAIVETPYGRFDGVRVIGDVNRCADFGWGVSMARGIGPVRWVQITIAGTVEWVLTDARIGDDLIPPSLGEKPLITNNGH
jgi:hypothetical protein